MIEFQIRCIRPEGESGDTWGIEGGTEEEDEGDEEDEEEDEDEEEAKKQGTYPGGERSL